MEERAVARRPSALPDQVPGDGLRRRPPVARRWTLACDRIGSCSYVGYLCRYGPNALSDQELRNAIEDLAAVPSAWPRPVLPELTVMLLAAGVLEQTRREMATSSLIAKIALGVAGLSLAVAIIAIFAS